MTHCRGWGRTAGQSSPDESLGCPLTDGLPVFRKVCGTCDSRWQKADMHGDTSKHRWTQSHGENRRTARGLEGEGGWKQAQANAPQHTGDLTHKARLETGAVRRVWSCRSFSRGPGVSRETCARECSRHWRPEEEEPLTSELRFYKERYSSTEPCE